MRGNNSRENRENLAGIGSRALQRGKKFGYILTQCQNEIADNGEVVMFGVNNQRKQSFFYIMRF